MHREWEYERHQWFEKLQLVLRGSLMWHTTTCSEQGGGEHGGALVYI